MLLQILIESISPNLSGQLLSASQFLLVLCYLTQEPDSKRKVFLLSLQAEFPWDCISSELKGRQTQLQALNTILPVRTVCKPQYCFDYSSFIVSLKIRYYKSYSLILLFQNSFELSILCISI